MQDTQGLQIPTEDQSCYERHSSSALLAPVASSGTRFWRSMKRRYLAGVPRLSYHDAAGLLTLWKQSEEYGWLSTVHSQVLQQCLNDLERAYTNLFAGRAAPPRYRKKFLADSFRYPQGFKLDGRKVYLPKIGWVEFWQSREIEGTVKNVTVSRQGQHWFVAFQVEMDLPEPVHPATADGRYRSGHCHLCGLLRWHVASAAQCLPACREEESPYATQARGHGQIFAELEEATTTYRPARYAALPIAATTFCISSRPRPAKTTRSSSSRICR